MGKGLRIENSITGVSCFRGSREFILSLGDKITGKDIPNTKKVIFADNGYYARFDYEDLIKEQLGITLDENIYILYQDEIFK